MLLQDSSFSHLPYFESHPLMTDYKKMSCLDILRFFISLYRCYGRSVFVCHTATTFCGELGSDIFALSEKRLLITDSSCNRSERMNEGDAEHYHGRTNKKKISATNMEMNAPQWLCMSIMYFGQHIYSDWRAYFIIRYEWCSCCCYCIVDLLDSIVNRWFTQTVEQCQYTPAQFFARWSVHIHKAFSMRYPS